MARKEISENDVRKCIYTLRGCQVMLDHDLADIYGVETKALKRAVRRNIERFPEDFMLTPTKDELENLRCQIGTSSLKNDAEARGKPILRSQLVTSSLENFSAHGGSRYTPFAFTELGVAMLSSVLHSERAIQVNIGIMRIFIQLRKGPRAELDLVPKIESIENRLDGFGQRLNHLESKSQSRMDSAHALADHDPVRTIQNVVFTTNLRHRLLKRAQS